jgi:hypothetical protein
MFGNVLRKKRLLNGDPTDLKRPERLFYDDPMEVFDTIFFIYKKLGKEKNARYVIDEFVSGKYGNFNYTIQYHMLLRAMMMHRDVPKVRDYYFKKMRDLIYRTHRKGVNLSTNIQNMINCEMAHHWITFYGNKNMALDAYKRVVEKINDAFEASRVSNERFSPVSLIIHNNMNGTHDPPLHIYQIEQLINPDINTMYRVLRVGFIIHATEKGKSSWFRWNKRNQFKELLVAIVELYSQLEYPLCGDHCNQTEAINECLLTYTSDPPVMECHGKRFESIERDHHVQFDRLTFKYKWYT